jgi:hypothetical protein
MTDVHRQCPGPLDHIEDDPRGGTQIRRRADLAVTRLWGSKIRSTELISGFTLPVRTR